MLYIVLLEFDFNDVAYAGVLDERVIASVGVLDEIFCLSCNTVAMLVGGIVWLPAGRSSPQSMTSS